MKATILAGLCGAVVMGAVTIAAMGQASPPAGTYAGVVNGTDVHVRARPGLTEYPCTKVSYPTRLTVVESQGGWLKILPVAGTFSVVDKQSVSLDATEKVGTVTDDVWIRAGGDLHSQDFWAFQCRVRKGTKLDIIGQTGDYYKITPPPGAYFWISARYVTPVSAPPVVPVRIKPPIVTTKGADAAADTRTADTSIVPVRIIKTTHTEPEIKAARAKFHAVDESLKAEFRKPPEQRDLAPIVDKYESLRGVAGGYLGLWIDSRVQYIRSAIQREKDIEATSELIDETEARHREYERSRAQLAKPTPVVVKGQPEYAVQGILSESAVFMGDRAIPKRYGVSGRHTKKIIGYVQCTTGAVDLSQYVGKEVGVTGTKRFEGDVGLIVEAQEVTILGETSGLPLPTAPTVIEQRPGLAPSGISPAPVPATVPKAQEEPVRRPLPVIKPGPTLTPATKPTPKSELSPIAEPIPKVEPTLRPRPKPVVPLTPLPELTPGPTVDGVPKIIPRQRPATMPATEPATMPVVKPVVPSVLPRTGFPKVESRGKGESSPINEEEYE